MAKKTIRKVANKKSKTKSSPAPAPEPAPVQVSSSQSSSSTQTSSQVTQVETWESSFERVVELQKALTSTLKQLNSEVKTLKKRFA